MGKSVHLFATIALALLASVGTLLVLPPGTAQGAAAPTEPGFTDSQVVSGLTNPTDMELQRALPPTGHHPMLSRPELLARVLAEAAAAPDE